MASSVKLEGLEQFKRALRELPEHLAQEATEVVRSASESAKAEVQQSYPQGPTGNLRRGVTRQEEHSRFGVSVRVRSRAKHAWLFENGVRGKGPRREVPESQKMIPIVIKHRKRMVEKLKDVVRKAGFQVE